MTKSQLVYYIMQGVSERRNKSLRTHHTQSTTNLIYLKIFFFLRQPTRQRQTHANKLKNREIIDCDDSLGQEEEEEEDEERMGKWWLLNDAANSGL